MALKKDYKFDQELIDAANYHFALGHPARVLIIQLLLQRSQLSFESLHKVIPLSKPTVSQHINILRRFYFITPVELPDGTSGYRLNIEVLKSVQSLCSELGLQAA